MSIKTEIIKRSAPRIIKQMNNAISLEEISMYEDRLAASIVTTMTFAGAAISVVVKRGGSVLSILMTALIFLLLGLLADYSVYSIENKKKRIFILNIVFIGTFLNVYFSYYDKLGIVLWSGLFVLILISSIRRDKSVFVSLGFTTFFLILNAAIYKNDTIIKLDFTYYFVQMALFGVIFVISFLWNHVSTKRLEASIDRYHDVVRGKEELTQLYEEVTANEEELREQNIKLIEYNNEIKENQERLNYMAYNDNLTGLPNRKSIIERIQILLDASDKRPFAIVFVDLDGFKKINDTLGHYAGDLFLKRVSQRILKSVSEEDTVGRLGGDEFTVLIQHDNKVEHIYEKVDKIRKELARAYEIENNSVFTSASFGIAMYPTDATDVVDLLKAADVAMYKAKEKGKNAIEFFEQGMHDEILFKIAMEQELASAIQNQEFFLVYQPQYNLARQEITGFEALIRWQSPSRGIVSPVDFISILEEMTAIKEVGDWVLVEACKKLKALEAEFNVPLKMSVNISPIQIEDENFVHRVQEIVKEFDITEGTLELEITESVFISNLEKAIERVEQLKEMGVLIALDDFGTGYSSLSYLKRLPIDVLKIDKSFIWDLDKGPKERNIVGTLIDLVHGMDIKVVAEGVETDLQKAYLEEELCDQIQGYLISKPVDEKEIFNKVKQLS